MAVFRMSEEERKRQALANYSLQQGIAPLKVQEQPKPTQPLTVTQQPTKFRVSVSPTPKVEPVKVSTPYSVRNFVSSQQDVKPDTRAWGTKLFDTLNPVDNGRSWAIAGKQTAPNFLQRNLSPTGIFNVGKEIVQGTARIAPELGQTVEQQYRVVKETDRLKKLGYSDKQAAEQVDSTIKSKTWKPSGWQKRLFGEEAKSYQEQAKDISQAVEQATGKKPSPAVTASALVITSGPLGGTGKYRKPFIKSLAKSKDANEILDLAAREGIQLNRDSASVIAMSEKVDDVANILERATKTPEITQPKTPGVIERPIKSIETPTPAVTDDIANTLTATSKPEEVRFVIDNLLPKLPEPEKVALANNVAKSTDTNQIKQLMDEAKLRESQLDETMQANTPAEAVPTTQAEQTQQAMEEAIPAPKPAPESTQAPISQEPTTTAPDGVQGATTAEVVPGAAPIEKTPTKMPNDPLEALKAEARKYKSAEEFVNSFNLMKSGEVTSIGQLPIGKVNKTQIKAITERGLPHTDTNLKAKDFTPGRKITQPLEVYSKGGSYVVENGNHRLAQAIANGDTHIPVVFKRGEGKSYTTYTKSQLTDLFNQATQSAPVEKTALTPREEINQINKKAALRGDKYTMSEEKRLAELKDQIINEPTTTTTQKTIIEVDSLYDGGKSSKDGSDLYGTPDGDKYIVEMPSQKDVETGRAKKAELNAQGIGYIPPKSQIVVKNANGDEVKRIDYDKAVKAFGTSDQNKLANLIANNGVEPVKSVTPGAPVEKTAPRTKGVAPKPAPESTQAPINQEPATTAPSGVQGATTADNVPETAAIDATKYDNPTKYLDARIRQIKDKSQQLKDYLRIYKLGSTEAGQNSPEYTKLVDDYKAKYGDTEAPEVTQIMDDFTASRQPVDVTADPVKQTFLGKVFETGKDIFQKTKEQLYDPWIEWDRISNKITKNMGLKRKDADPLFNLTDLINKRVTVSQVSDRVLLAKNRTGQSVAEVFAKYPDVDVAKGVQDNAFVRYLQSRFFLEVYDKSGGKIWKGQGYTPDDAARSISDFEARNPTARLDADTVKAWADDWVDYKVANNEISAEHGNNLKNAYSVYTPLERAPTPDLISPTFSGGRGGVGTEQIAQNITEVAGNYDTSLASIKNRNLRYTQESTDNDILLALDKAYRNKYIDEADDVYIAIDPEKVEQREAVVSRLEETRAKIDELKKQRNKANRQAKKAKAKLKQAEASAKNIVRSEKQKEYAKTVEKLRAGIDKAKVKLKVQKAKLGLPQYRTQQAETKAVTTARNELLKTVSDTDAKAVISKMTKEDLIDVFQAMADDAPIQAGVWGRLKKLNVTRKQYNKLVDDITGQRQAILIAKQQLTDFIGENRNIGAIGKMSDDEIIDALDIIASKDVKSAADASERLRAKGGFYQELSDQLQATRDELDIKKAEAAGDWAEAARLNQVKPQYENLVPYFKNGYKGYMHVNKNMASEMNSMRTAAKPNLVEKGIRGVSNAQKWVFTGGAAPVFKLVTNPIRNVTQMAVLGRGLSAFGARPMAAGAKSVFTRAEKDTYTQRLIDYGLRLELSTKSPTARNTGVKELASKTSKAGRLKYLAKNPGELYRTLNSGMAKLDNAARIQVAKGAELNARRRHPDWSEDQIMSFAASEGNNVLGNFNRVSRLARDAEVINNYSGATQTGFRQLMKTFRERPIETGTKVMSLVGTVAGITGYMLAGDMSDDYKETMKEYYDQQIASGNTNELDSNIIIGIPGKVKYDEATNTWTGIVKKPLPPDYKPLIRASWRTAYDIASNKPFNPALIGKELANFATADQRGNIRDPKTGVWLPNSPLADLGRLFMGQDQNTGKPLVTEQQSYLPKSEQYNKYTSDLAKFFSKVTKGSLSPIQIDAIFSQSGYFGTKLKSVETEAEKNIGILRSVAKDFTSRVYGSRGYSEKQEKGKKFSEGMESLLRKYKLDENQFDIVQTLFPTNKDKDGKDIKPEGYYVSSIKAQQLANSLMSDGKVWEFAKEASRLSQEPGDPSDPLYDLDKDKAEIVLALMSRADPQSLDKKKIMKDNPWIKEFYTKRGEFFDNLISKKNMDYERDVQAGLMTQEDLDEIKSDAGKDFMGMKIPKMSPELKAKQAELDKLDKGTDAAKRYEFMKNNPDLQEFYDDNSSYNRFKRSVMRLPLFDEYPEASQKVKNIMDEYYALPKDNGPISKYTGEATSPDRSAWFEANPEKAALLTEQWYKQNIFNLQGAAALATYEGESLDESAFDDIKQIADYREKLENGGSGYGGYSRFGYGGGGSKSKKTTEQQIADQLSPNISSFIAGIKPSEFGPISQVNTKPSTTKFKVKLPSGSTKKARIRLQ